MWRSNRKAAGRGHDSRAIPSREARASTRSAAPSLPRVLEAAIDAAELVRREPDEDGERIAVFCNALGGAFIFSKEEAERRVLLRFPDLELEAVDAAARFLESRVRLFLRPAQVVQRQKSSWVHGWRSDY